MTETTPFASNLASIRAIEADICAGKHREAAIALNALIAATPNDPRLYLSGAMLAHAARNPQQEIAALRCAVAAAPAWPQAYIELARALSRQGKHAEALATANKAAELAPQELRAIEVAVAVANAAGNLQTAQQHLQAALALRPGDISISKALGMCLGKQARHGDAETHWRAVIAANPDDAFALGWLGECLMGLGRKEEACAALQRAVTLSPERLDLAFHLAIARGETPRHQPREMIRQLFDEYADHFDQHLVERLQYRVPDRVAQLIREHQPDLNVSVLDLGCGTGLLAVHLGRVSGAFVGVDVSPRMLEQAARHGVYSELRQNDLLEELRRIAANSFDYVIANDVFIYVGDLSDIIPAAFNVLRSGGALIFSCEAADASEGELVLRPSKRYAHSRASIQTLCRDAGFSGCEIEPIDLRIESGQAPIAGFIALAQKV